jgi:CheY-like chemotaxis protein
LDVAAELAPNVALLDIGLPVMDGFELADLLRERLAVAPVLLAVTGYGQPTDIARTRSAGFDDHFTKPIDFDRLRGEIRRLERQLAG